MASSSLMTLLRKGFKAYFIIAVAHATLRFIRSVLEARRRRRMLKDVPVFRCPSHRLLGHLPDMVNNLKRMHHWRMECTNGLPLAQFKGPVWSADGFLLVARDPIIIRHFLKDQFDKYSKFNPETDWVMRYLVQFLGNGIFSAMHGDGATDKGEHWKNERKTASMIFSRKNFKTNMNQVFVEKAKQLSTVLSSDQKTDMQLHFFNYTMDSIMKILFGISSNQVGGDDNTYASNYDIAHRAFFQFGLSTIPLFEIVRFLPWPFGGMGLAVKAMEVFSPLHREFCDALKILDSESVRLIRECRADPALHERADLLALFVQAEGAEKTSTKELRDTVLNFIIAGRDTTACTLSWMFYILATHPDLQRRIHEEVDLVHPPGVEPSFDSVKPEKVPLLHALLWETLRLYPPVPFDGKECYTPDVLPDGTHIPVGTKMIFLPYAMGRDPKTYPEPEVVRLERWIPFTSPPHHEFPVFQAGPRYCLGAEMAQFEAKIAATILLRDWSFTLAPGEAEKIHYSSTLTMAVCNSKEQDSHNLWLIPQSRRSLGDSWMVPDPPARR